MFNIEENHLKIILNILNQYAPGCEIRVFGSRFDILSPLKEQDSLDTKGQF